MVCDWEDSLDTILVTWQRITFDGMQSEVWTYQMLDSNMLTNNYASSYKYRFKLVPQTSKTRHSILLLSTNEYDEALYSCHVEYGETSFEISRKLEVHGM